MKNLIQFELRKILTRRLTLFSVAFMLLFSFILSFSTLQNMYAFDGVHSEGKGKTAVEIDQAIAAKYTGILTDQKVQQMLSDFKPTHDLHGLNAKYIYQNAMQSATFSRFSDMNGNWNGVRVSDIFGHEEIQIGYVNSWLNTSQNMAKIMVSLSFVIILMIAPVFASEYNGVDKIILTSKYGKTKCATAKVVASLISSLLITLLIISFNLASSFIIYGTDGLNCSILFSPQEFIEMYIPFNLTCGMALKYQFLLAFTGAISVTGITLILSAICNNQMIAFVVSATIYFIPIMLPIAETGLLYKRIVLMPIYHSQYISLMSVEQMQNGMLYAVWAFPISAILFVLGSLLSRRRFAKHQVR